MQRDELRRDSGVIVVEQHRRYTAAIGLMIVILALGLAVSETNPYSVASPTWAWPNSCWPYRPGEMSLLLGIGLRGTGPGLGIMAGP